MTTEPAESPEPARDPATSDRATQSVGGLKKLLEQLKAQSERALEPARRLNQRIDAQMSRSLAEAEHVFGVFQVGSSNRLMVLRDVEELNGKKPSYTAPNFAAAMQFANQRLVDTVYPTNPPLDWNRLVSALEHLAVILDHVEAGNARLTGSGTVEDPYVSNGPLHVRAPVTLGFPVPVANLRLAAQGGVLRAATVSSSP